MAAQAKVLGSLCRPGPTPALPCKSRPAPLSAIRAHAQAYFSEVDANGVSLHSHLAEVIHKLLLEKPKDALETFESLSLETKGKHFKAAEKGGLKVPLRAVRSPLERIPAAAATTPAPPLCWVCSCHHRIAPPALCAGPARGTRHVLPPAQDLKSEEQPTKFMMQSKKLFKVWC